MRAIDGDRIVKILNECIDKILAIQNLDITYNPKLSAELQVYKDMLEEINEMPTIDPEPHWIPCSERLSEEDHRLGGSGRQFSDEVLVSVENYDDEDIWTYISQTIDGKWELELPRHCKIVAWMPLPEPYQEERRTDEHDDILE